MARRFRARPAVSPEPQRPATRRAPAQTREWPATASWQPGDGARRPRQFQNVQAGIGAVDDVDVAPRVGLDIVGLDRDLAALLLVDLDASLVGRRRNRGNEVADFGGMIGIANVERANAGVEERDEGHLLVEHRRHALVGGMRAEPTAALAEIAARLPD